MEDSLLTMDDVTALLRVHRATVYSLMRRGKFPAPLKLGHGIRWRQSAIDTWLDSLPLATGDVGPNRLKD